MYRQEEKKSSKGVSSSFCIIKVIYSHLCYSKSSSVLDIVLKSNKDGGVFLGSQINISFKKFVSVKEVEVPCCVK